MEDCWFSVWRKQKRKIANLLCSKEFQRSKVFPEFQGKTSENLFTFFPKAQGRSRGLKRCSFWSKWRKAYLLRQDIRKEGFGRRNSKFWRQERRSGMPQSTCLWYEGVNVTHGHPRANMDEIRGRSLWYVWKYKVLFMGQCSCQNIYWQKGTHGLSRNWIGNPFNQLQSMGVAKEEDLQLSIPFFWKVKPDILIIHNLMKCKDCENWIELGKKLISTYSVNVRRKEPKKE